MKIGKIMSVLLVISALFLIASSALCASPIGTGEKAEGKTRQNHRKQKATEQILKSNAIIKEGKIDSLILEDFLNSESKEAITLVGFESGDGCILQGRHPGLRVGKSVRFTLKDSKRIFMGTMVFEVIKIEKLSEGVSADKDETPQIPPTGF